MARLGAKSLVALSLVVVVPTGARAQGIPYSFTRIADTLHNDPGLGGVHCVGMSGLGTVIVVFAPAGSSFYQLWRGNGQSFTQVETSLASTCASINDSDETAYLTPLSPGSGVVRLVKNSGGTLTTLARSDVTPFLYGPTTHLPSLSNSGSAVFMTAQGNGIAVGPAGPIVYNPSTDPPLLPSSPVSMNESLTVAFLAQAGGTLGIYRGSAVPLIETGSVVAGGTVGISLVRPVINNSGTVAFVGSVGGIGAHAYTTSDGVSVTLVGTNPIDRLAINDSGAIAYRKNTSGGSAAGEGLYVGQPGSIDKRVIGFGDPLDGSTFQTGHLWEESLNNYGQIAFWAQLADGRWGVYRANPVPVLTSLSPSSAAVGGAGFTLTVTGSHFVNGSQIRWNGAARPTTFVNQGQLQAVIPASDIATTGIASVTVVNPAPGTGTSNALPFTIAPTMALDKTALVFGAVTSGTTFLFKTSAQAVRLTQTGNGNVTWTATSNQPWLQVTPASGTGSATLSIGLTFTSGLPSSGSLNAAVSLTFSGAANSPGPIAIKLNMLSGTTAPIGFVDTPIDRATGITGAVPFTGWAIDDVELTRVMICRGAVGAEVAPVDPNCAGQAQIFVGFPVFIDLARPDVAAAYPEIPLNTRAGWGFMVLTNMLPSQGNGTFVFYIWAEDREGNRQLLGTRTITCDNAHATKPFGAIDTPTQGGIASGSTFVNFGWALTPLQKTIPTNGSTITVVVDGASIGTVDYNHPRLDIQGLFPGLNNTNGAIGFRVIDTTTLTNGAHTISWTVVDNQGAIEGIGSRYFTVSNGASAITAAPVTTTRPTDVATAARAETPVLGRRGWDLEAPWRWYGVGSSGRAVIRGEEIDRFEVWLGAQPEAHYTGHLRVGDGFVPLPVGSQLDAATGWFTWAPGVGFVGPYDLVFVRWSGMRPVARHEVRIILAPKGRGHVGVQVAIDTPRSQQDVGQPFVLAGWAADLDTATGTGIDTLHVWAYQLAGGAPVFLGTPILGGARPDVAAIHGDQFRAAGFTLPVQGLTPGIYDLAVFPWSNVTGAFAPPQIVHVTVR